MGAEVEDITGVVVVVVGLLLVPWSLSSPLLSVAEWQPLSSSSSGLMESVGVVSGGLWKICWGSLPVIVIVENAGVV